MNPSPASDRLNAPTRALIHHTLNRLCDTINAKNGTCLFHNPYSGLYWLFEKGGRFDYPYQMCGPLIHVRRAGRFQRAGRNLETVPGTRIEMFANSDFTPMKTGIFTEWSFVEREGIVASIRVTLSGQVDAAVDRDKSASAIFIFLNFTTCPAPERERALVQAIRAELGPLADVLLAMASRPYLDDHTAWVLRSTSLRLRNRLEDLRLSVGPHRDSQEAELFNWIATAIAEHLVPRVEPGARLISISMCRASSS
jgi:hypothetical protein